jgi:hypothetical protein
LLTVCREYERSRLPPLRFSGQAEVAARPSAVSRMTRSEIFMSNKSASCFTGFIVLLGGLYVYSSSNSLDWISEALQGLPNPAAAWLFKSAFWLVMSLCLTGGALALLTLGSPKTSWQHRLGVIGTIVTLLGVLAYLIGCLYVAILLVEHYAFFLYRGFHFG